MFHEYGSFLSPSLLGTYFWLYFPGGCPRLKRYLILGKFFSIFFDVNQVSSGDTLGDFRRNCFGLQSFCCFLPHTGQCLLTTWLPRQVLRISLSNSPSFYKMHWWLLVLWGIQNPCVAQLCCSPKLQDTQEYCHCIR